jgi:hypothetical protein
MGCEYHVSIFMAVFFTWRGQGRAARLDEIYVLSKAPKVYHLSPVTRGGGCDHDAVVAEIGDAPEAGFRWAPKPSLNRAAAHLDITDRFVGLMRVSLRDKCTHMHIHLHLDVGHR